MRIGDLGRVASLVSEAAGRRVLIATHRRADVDAYVSSYLAMLLLSRRSPASCEVYIPEGPSTRSSGVADLVSMEYLVSESELGSYDLVVLLDVGGPSVVPGFDRIVREAASVLIDHHHHAPEFISRFTECYVDDETSSSTCELVLDLAERMGESPRQLLDRRGATAAVAAVLVESRFFQIARADTFRRVYGLMSAFGSEILGEAFKAVRSRPERSERIAMLKGVQRVSLYEAGGYLIAISHLSAYQANLAARLIGLGADIAVVYGIDDDRCRVSVRLSEDARKGLNLNAAEEFMSEIGRRVRCEGGGHPASAMITFPRGDMDLAGLYDVVRSALSSILSRRGLELEEL